MELTALTDEMRKRAGQNVKLGYKVKFVLADGEGVISWIRCSDVVPLTAHTRFPDRSLACEIAESRGARIR